MLHDAKEDREAMRLGFRHQPYCLHRTLLRTKTDPVCEYYNWTHSNTDKQSQEVERGMGAFGEPELLLLLDNKKCISTG